MGTSGYQALLEKSFRQVKAVLTLNPAVAGELTPHCDRIEVVTWGMDPARFPWPRPSQDLPGLDPTEGVQRIVFAGLVEEPIKGVSVQHEALCEVVYLVTCGSRLRARLRMNLDLPAADCDSCCPYA